MSSRDDERKNKEDRKKLESYENNNYDSNRGDNYYCFLGINEGLI